MLVPFPDADADADDVITLLYFFIFESTAVIAKHTPLFSLSPLHIELATTGIVLVLVVGLLL